jgi:hypothetical protein
LISRVALGFPSSISERVQPGYTDKGEKRKRPIITNVKDTILIPIPVENHDAPSKWYPED